MQGFASGVKTAVGSPGVSLVQRHPLERRIERRFTDGDIEVILVHHERNARASSEAFDDGRNQVAIQRQNLDVLAAMNSLEIPSVYSRQ